MGTDRWTPGHYSLYRIALGALLVVHFAALLPWAGDVFGAGGSVAQAQLSPFHGVLPNPLWRNDSIAMVVAMLALGVGCGLSVMLGWGDRIAALLAVLLLAWLFQRNPLIANPSLPLLGWMLLLHLFVPPRPYGSLAGALRGTDPEWRLPRHLHLAAWIVLALSYSHSGWTKLASAGWVEGEAIRQVLENPLAREHLLRHALLATPPIVLQLLTWIVLVVELLFAPLALLRSLRPWLWGAMLAAQIGFLVFLDFADLTAPMLLAHLLVMDPAWLDRRATRPAVLLFDGDCVFCQGCVRLALHEDARTLLRFAPLSGRTAHALVDADELQRGGESIVLAENDGRISLRSRAVIGVLDRLGGVWTAFALLLRAVPQRVADAGYDFVGRHRRRFGRRAMDGFCPVLPPGYRARVLP